MVETLPCQRWGLRLGVSQLGCLATASVTPAGLGVSLRKVPRELKGPTQCLHLLHRPWLRVSNNPGAWVRLDGPQGPVLCSQHEEHGLSARLHYLPHTLLAAPQEGPCSYPISQRHQGPQPDKAQKIQDSNQGHLICRLKRGGHIQDGVLF